MTINKSRTGDQMLESDFVARTTNSLSPEPLVRPRKVKMPVVFDPECIFMERASKGLLSRLKQNLSKLREDEQ